MRKSFLEKERKQFSGRNNIIYLISVAERSHYGEYKGLKKVHYQEQAMGAYHWDGLRVKGKELKPENDSKGKSTRFDMGVLG